VTVPYAAPAPAFRPRPVSYLLIITGSVLGLIALTTLSWYSITGPSVITNLTQLNQPTGDTAGGVIVYVGTPGTHHSPFVWVTFTLCVIAAFAAAWPRARGNLVARTVAPALALLIIANSVWRAANQQLFDYTSSGLEPKISFTVDSGFWIAVVGFALIGVGAALGPRRVDRPWPHPDS
jgi:hypothetical protein